ncbi:MAG TPA: asparagine synthase (glutamine-hydrolyzing) [Acidimicrobiales bacterium]|nr:asparagine synthase (glutamine-hydrolyzing) [Acidimicrobiales bacterium]
MCGIAGVIESTASRDPTALVQRVDAMLDAIDHRGPDARNARSLDAANGARATLGAVRLRIIDVAPTADQPMSDGAGAVWTAFNGELYNFKELRGELSAAGYAFRSGSDTECLVHLWDYVDGDVDRMAARLRGMFAFAVWDTRTGRGALVRDRLGIKPLFWAATANGVAFCSEQRALARGGFVDGSPNGDVVAGYLAKGVVASGSTILRGVHSLGPGEHLTWDAGSPTVGQWWRPVFTLRADLLDRTRAVEEVRSAVGDAVARHLVADRTVGVFLSSGTDSSAVAALAARTGPQRSLTVRFPDEPELDEGALAAATANRLGFDHTEVPTTGEDAAAGFPQFLKALDSPTADGFNSWLVCRAARQAGLVVALSGLGGDELFAGYRTFDLVPRLSRVLPVINRLPPPARYAAARVLRTNERSRPFARALAAGTGPAAAYHATRGLFDCGELAELGLAPPVLASLDRSPHPLDAVTLLELGAYLRDQLLPDSDTTSMAHSLEVRVPLLDDRVVAAALALPPSVRRQGKDLLAEAADLGPRTAKRTFTLPIARWLRGPLRTVIRTAILDDDLAYREYLPHGFRARLWRDFESGRDHWSKVWAVGVLRLWPEANGFAW